MIHRIMYVAQYWVLVFILSYRILYCGGARQDAACFDHTGRLPESKYYPRLSGIPPVWSKHMAPGLATLGPSTISKPGPGIPGSRG